MTDVVIVGGGIAGLAAAWELVQRGRRPLLLEAAPRAGGVILTEQVDGFVIDAGPDSLLVQKPAAVSLCGELGLGDRLLPMLPPRTAFILRRGALVPIPEASFLGLPTRIAPFVRSRLFSWRGKLRMARELIIPPRPDDADESIASFIGRRFGAEAVDYLAEPLLAGIHAGDVRRLSINALFPRLADAERTHGSVLRALASTRTPSSPRGAFVSLPGGIGEMTHALLDQLPAGTIRCGAPVSRIAGHGPFVVTIGESETISARAVIVAVPAWSAATLLAEVDAELAALCGRITYASTAIAAFGLRAEQVRHPMRGTGFVVPRVERRHVMAGTWVSSKWPQRAPDGHVLLRAFMGGAVDPTVLDHSDEALSRRAFAELAALLQISGEPVLTRVYRWPRASAQHNVGHLDLMRSIDACIGERPGLFVTGSGFRGTGIPDCVADARATAGRAASLLQ